MNWIKIIVRVLLALFFAVSAVSKIMSVDAFEVYFYRIAPFEFDTASIIARLVIGVELLLAVFLLFKLKYRAAWYAALVFLIIMTAFLLSQVAAGSTEDCYCLGELVDFSPIESLIKNLLLIALLFLVRKQKAFSFGWSGAVASVVAVAALVAPFVVSTPDLFIRSGYEDMVSYDQAVIDELFEQDYIPAAMGEGKKVLAFLSTGCRFCKMTTTRLSVITRDLDELNQGDIYYLFPNKKEAVQTFYEENNSLHFDFSIISLEQFLKATKGSMPVIVLMEDGRVQDKMNYRTIEEERFSNFFEGTKTAEAAP